MGLSLGCPRVQGFRSSLPLYEAVRVVVTPLVLIPVAGMGRVTVLIVNVVDVVAVRDRLVVTALCVIVAVVAMLGMGRLAFVPMAVLPVVHVPLVKVVAMAVVVHGGVPAIGAMFVGVIVMRSMVGVRHGMPPACGVTGSIALSARCFSVSLTMLASSQPTLRSV
jgi:hypothetical protein